MSSYHRGERYRSSSEGYVDMLLRLDSVTDKHKFLAAGATWLLLAGFLVLPGTFSSLQHSSELQELADANVWVASVVRNPPLLAVATLCCVVAITTLGWLWWRQESNHLWLINYLFSSVSTSMCLSTTLIGA